MRDWVKSVPETLARLTGQPLSELDCTDDRLADGLRYLSVDADWHRIEQQVGQHLIRVYDLPTARVRLDSTTATVGHDPEQHTLFQVGKTKAGTYDTQFKLMLASLDPLGLPLAADVVAGNCADDPAVRAVLSAYQGHPRTGWAAAGGRFEDQRPGDACGHRRRAGLLPAALPLRQRRPRLAAGTVAAGVGETPGAAPRLLAGGSAHRCQRPRPQAGAGRGL